MFSVLIMEGDISISKYVHTFKIFNRKSGVPKLKLKKVQI